MVAPISGTIYGRIRQGVYLIVGDTAAQATWEADEPVDESIFINLQTQTIAVWDADTGVSDNYPLGGVDSIYNADAPSSGTTWVISDLIGATVKGAMRGGIGIRLVSGTPAAGQFSFDSTTGTVTINSSDVFGGEWWRFECTGIQVGAGV